MLRPNAVVELIWQDETGSRASTMLNVPSSSTYDEIDASASALASILVPLSGASLVATRYKYRFEVNPRVEPENSTPISRSGAFFFSTDADLPDGFINVPSITEGVISGSEPGAGVEIDVGNSDVVAFVASVLTAGLTNPFGDAIAALVAAYRQSRV